MRLSELEPELLKRGEGESECWNTKDVSFEQADGVWFLCPTCFQNNKGNVGTHGIICWRPRVPAGISPGPGRWEFQGTSIEDLTLVAGSSSVLLQGGCNAHFYIRNGEIIFT